MTGPTPSALLYVHGRRRAEEGVVPLLQVLRIPPRPRCSTGTRCSYLKVGACRCLRPLSRQAAAEPLSARPITRRALCVPGGLRGRVSPRSLLHWLHSQRSPLRPFPGQSGEHQWDQDLRRQLADVGGSGGTTGLPLYPLHGAGVRLLAAPLP